MASNNNTERQEPTTELPTTDSVPELEEDATSEVDEQEMREWLSARYKGSKKPMKERLTAPLDVPISDADVEKLKVGFKSQSMDDKWDLLVEDPDEEGGFSIHIVRNWLQDESYILHISPKPTTDDDDANSGGSSTTTAKIHRITWEGNKNNLQCGAEQAMKEAVMLCRGWLGCEIEGLPDYPSSAFWDFSAYKKLGEPDDQPGSSSGGGSTAKDEEAEAPKEVNKSLLLHVMSLGTRYWNEKE